MHTHRVESLRAASSFTINEGEKKEIPFTYHLPLDLPISAQKCVSYFFKTHLDIEGGVDSTDRDPVRIKAPKSLYQLVEGFEALGFQRKSIIQENLMDTNKNLHFFLQLNKRDM